MLPSIGAVHDGRQTVDQSHDPTHRRMKQGAQVNCHVALSPGLSKITPLGLRSSFLGCTAKLSRLACSAHLRHLRNSSGACIRGPPYSSIQPHKPDERREVPGTQSSQQKKTRQEI